MTLLEMLWAYFKTTRIGKFFLSIFTYFYIRWRVFRAVSTDPDDDSLESSLYDTGRKRVIRSTSLYPESCPSSLRDKSACQKPGCIDIYRQFMNYGSADETIPGHIFLSNSISYYANSETELCQLSKEDSEEGEEESLFSWSQEIVHDSDLISETSANSEVLDEEFGKKFESEELNEAENAVFESYTRWFKAGNEESENSENSEESEEHEEHEELEKPEEQPKEPVENPRPRRMLPKTPEENDYSQRDSMRGEPVNVQFSPFAHLQSQSERGAEVMTYPEVQRQVRNYFFTSPMYFESDENRKQEEQRLDEIGRQRKKKVTLRVMKTDTLADTSYSVSRESLKSDSCISISKLHTFDNRWNDSYSTYSDFASTVVPTGSSDLSDYRTASVSSPVAKEISDRFSRKYWSVDDHCGDGAVGARDNYHNRYFGKAGYYLTRNAVENYSNGRDTMPAVEKRALMKERRRWTDINARGGQYDDVELGIPDTNGRNTNRWNEEYEEPLPSHTSVSWKTPKFMKMPSQNPALFQCEQKCLRSAHSLVGGVVVKGVAVAVVGVALVVVVGTGGAGERDLMTALKVCDLIIERVNEPSHSGGRLGDVNVYVDEYWDHLLKYVECNASEAG